jgi:fumarate reductase subunit D
MNRSNEPVFWALFGAGGMLSALVGPVLIFVTGIAAPAGFVLSRQAMSYQAMLAFARNPIGKVAVLLVISLFLFHGCHRMVHSLHDLGVGTGPTARIMFYGFASTASFVALMLLIRIGREGLLF